MILKSIRLRGFRGFRAGLGIDEVFLDLSALPDGLVAICGPNGAGKTTLLDNLHPYRIQPYKIRKAKDWSPGAFSYYDQCSGSDACKELIFEMGGVAYRSLILIDADKRKQEAYLYQDNYSGLNVTEHGWVPLNDGKVKTYDEAVEKVCGSPSLFFTSVFRCQGAKNLSDYTRGDIMQIISELLNIDHIREQSEKCRAVVSGLSAGLSLARDRMVGLAAEVESATGLVASIQLAKNTAALHQVSLDQSESDLDVVRDEIVKVREQQAAQESESARLAMLKSQLADEEKRLVDARHTAVKMIMDIERRVSDTTANRDKAKSGLQERIARAEKIVLGGVGIREAVVMEQTFIDGVDREKTELSRLAKDRDEYSVHLSKWTAEASGLNAEIKAMEFAVAKLEGLDCNGSGWLNPDCKFISDAITGRDNLPESLAYRTKLQADCIVMSDKLSAVQAAITACNQSLAQAETNLKECQRFTRLLPELEQAELNLAAWRDELAEVDRSADSDLKALDGDKWCAESEWDLARMKFEGQIRKLQDDIAVFPLFVDLAAQLRELTIREAALLSSISGFERQIRDIELEIASLRTKLEAAQYKGGELDLLKAKESRLSVEIAKFSLLMKACSNDGIIALEIDDSGAGISSIANSLLSSCYGSRFSVRFDTQTAKVNGDMKNDFDVIVYDSEVDESRSLTELSGGQCAWINDALTRAICLFNIHSSGKTYGTLFVDEVDGALDASRKQEFFLIKRKAMELGSHSREYFISQSPELIEMAEARILLAPGGISIC